MNISAVARRAISALGDSESDLANELVRQYGAAWKHLKAEIERLRELVRDAEDALLLPELKGITGRELVAIRSQRLSWLRRQQRYEILQRDIQSELRALVDLADHRVSLLQSEAIIAAQNDARQLTLLPLQNAAPAEYAQAVVRWNAVPTEAVARVVGYVGDGSPLRAVLLSHANEAAGEFADSLIQGVALGWNPRKIARNARAKLGVPLARSLTIARTETLRAYRDTAIAAYQANDDVVEKWRWCAHLGARTCAACLAMDGKEFPVTTEFGSHPNCRCTPVPVVDWEQFDVPKSALPQERETGADWLQAQSEAVQREVMGAKYDAWKSGQIQLSDVVGVHRSEEWGVTRYEKSAKALGIETGGN